MLDLFNWYRINLCGQELIDPRKQRVCFSETDFVHLIKMTDKYAKEPKNRQMTVDQIRSGRIQLDPKKFCIKRAQELSWARTLVEEPDVIVNNWQVMGKANPGDAYIKNFGNEEAPIYRVLICGRGGKKRWAVTIFPRERFSELELRNALWP